MPPIAPPRRSPYGRVIRLLGWFILGVILYRVFFYGPAAPASKLPRIATVPPFALTERSGKTVTNTGLLGRIWVADFIYTTCPGPCPLVTAGMEKLQEAVADDPRVQLVTFTVDPQDDTPPVLAAYAAKFNADPNRWWFLTGAQKPLYDLIQNGFYLAVQDNRGAPPQPGQFLVTHSTKLALVDADGTVRGYYDGLDPAGRTQLLKDITVLEKEENL
jgi:protein SCO1/2